MNERKIKRKNELKKKKIETFNEQETKLKYIKS